MVVALLVTIVTSELCYRFVETPVRRGALGRWWTDHAGHRTTPLAGVLAGVAVLALFYASVDQFDRAAGGDEATFELTTTPTAPRADGQAPSPTVAADDEDPALDTIGEPAAATAPEPAQTAPATTTPAPPSPLPRSVAIVGDSQAHSLFVNTPDGLGSTLNVVDGSIDGCSVYDEGSVHSSRDGFRNTFTICTDWQSKWAAAAAQAEIALVVLGAWDVFDLETSDAGDLTFGTSAWDAYFLAHLRSGIEAMRSSGAQVALLEVACMRPQDVEGAGVPALPERGDDARVAHLNDLLRSTVSDGVTFIEGPDAWCNDEALSTDLAMRWDGVHVYKPGAELIYETIAPALVALPGRTG